MAAVTTEHGVYADAGTPDERHCRVLIVYDNATLAVFRFDSWENTYPFAWEFTARKPSGLTFTTTIPANHTRTQRMNVAAGWLITDEWGLTRA